MSRPPALRPEEIIRVLLRAGFSVRRQTSSHIILYRRGLPRPISVPVHRRTLAMGTQHGIIRQAGLTMQEFMRLLRSGD